MEKSYYIVYQEGSDIGSALRERGLNNFIILNERLAVLYTPLDFNSNILRSIYEVSWYSESDPMSSMIDLTNYVEAGDGARSITGVDYIYNNVYNDITGRGVLIAIIDSGVDYLHPDLIRDDGSSKILKLWDQEGTINPPPEGYLFGSEYTREELNAAIARNDGSLSRDDVGTGTMAAGITVGSGRINSNYEGITEGSDLIVVKLKSYPGRYYVEKRNYTTTDFLAAFSYAINIALREEKSLIINLTVGQRSSLGFITLLNTFTELEYPGIVVVSGAGNQRNTYIHYAGRFRNQGDVNDIIIEYGDGQNLDIYLEGGDLDRINATIISPSGELSYTAPYAPDYYEYIGVFNLENTTYRIRYFYPWTPTGSELLEINLRNMKPGAWTLRVRPDVYLNGEYHVYLPNSNLIGPNDGFIDTSSFSTITSFGTGENIITVGAYDNRYDSIWIGSSKGPTKGVSAKPDFVAPGVNIISTYGNDSYRSGTGTGISSSVTSGMLALIMEYLSRQGTYPKLLLYSQVLKTYLMLGSTRDELYEYPNDSLGYGVIDFRRTIQIISDSL
ncbi:S8 family peptidase [Clostridioides mangenotii]|uniref:bile acid germinant receptor pseudoprotease CspC n=1 Tax=Metaclostridioides mangenotii TaxID=1540 RepID=UPI001C108CD2|nr:bile acid germinant receptor pseudoprotease CspC [Clostridioides mangenotii]MBU5306769.1 S8 family peptidase [Clostridioides mangenotii]